MSSKFLPVYKSNGLYEAARRVPATVGKRASQGFVLELCQNLRIAGIADLFLTGGSRELHLRLQQSGQAFAYFLQGAHDDAKRTGRSLPFFDAIAAGDPRTAGLIAMAARRTWARGDEYEEDFLFVDFLMHHFYLGRPAADSQAVLARYEQALEGAEDLRLDVCRALLAADADAFDQALPLYLGERRAKYDELEEKGAEAPEVLATEAHLSVEGVALVRLAVRSGLSVREDYPQVPSIALEDAAGTAAPDSWTRIAA